MKFSTKHGLSACAMTLLMPMVLAGCGGGSGSAGGNTVSKDAMQGGLVFHIVFPKVTRNATQAKRAAGRGAAPGTIPMGAHSVKISLTEPTSGRPYTADRIVNDTVRPNGVDGSISVAYAVLPVGPVQVNVIACPDLNAAGNPLATGTTNGAITAFQTTTISVPMTLTLKSLTLSPATQTLSGFPSSGTVTARALDAAGNPLLYPLEYSVGNTNLLTITDVSSDFTMATIASTDSSGTTTVTVTEPNSGMTATAQVILR